MKSKMIFGVLGVTIAMPVWAETYQAQVPTFNETNKTQRLQNNPWQDIGTVMVAGQSLPAYAVSVRNPVDDGWLTEDETCRPKACVLPVSAKVKHEHLNQLMAVRVGGIGWVLAPKSWRNIEADVGVNGSQSVLMQSPDGREYLSHYHTGACTGCALVSAAPFFPPAFKMAQSYEYAPQKPNPNIKLVRAQNNKVLFSYRLPNQHTTHGVASWNGSADEPFRDFRVTVRQENTALAGTILNVGVLEF